jgi:hypothetical protein
MADKPKNKLTFKVEIDGKEVELAVKKPNMEQKQKGQIIYARAFREAVEGRAILQDKIAEELVNQGLWNDEKAKKEREIVNSLLDKESKLRSGGIKLSEAKQIALDMASLRSDLRVLTAERTQFNSVTAEGIANNTQFNYFVSACTVYADSGATVFKSVDDYMAQSDDELGSKAAANLMLLLYNLDPDFEKSLPENKFLREHKFVDDKMFFLDKNGNRVDSEGRKIDANGYYLNERGERVDRNGKRLDDKGEYIVEFKPFIDDVYDAPVVKQETDTSPTA